MQRLLRVSVMLKDINDVNDAVADLGMLLTDESIGLVRNALEIKYLDKYDNNNTLVGMFDCMVEEVNAINNVLELHDFLASIRDNDWNYLINGKFDLKSISDMELLEMRNQVNVELSKREYYKNSEIKGGN